MPDLTFTKLVTKRFFLEMERIIKEDDGEQVTVKDFAEAVGSTEVELSVLKDAEQDVTIEMCCRLCENFGTSPGWLLMGEEDPE
jgi:plasmid maintenance system antidote protein VapI